MQSPENLWVKRIFHRNEQKWTAMNKFEQKWTEINRNEQKWAEMDRNEQQWTEMNRNERKWEEKLKLIYDNMDRVDLWIVLGHDSFTSKNYLCQNDHQWYLYKLQLQIIGRGIYS